MYNSKVAHLGEARNITGKGSLCFQLRGHVFWQAAWVAVCCACGWFAVFEPRALGIRLYWDKVTISRALATLECGSSPQVWLSALRDA